MAGRAGQAGHAARRHASRSLDRTFEALVFDWDGTAVPDRRADAAGVRSRVEALCAAGVHVVVVSGTHVGNVDGQLRARPAGPGHLFLCLNRGSEVFDVNGDRAELVWQRTATADEDRALDRAAALTVERLRSRGLAASVVSERLNRRKIDLIADPAWADPPKARIGELLDAVNRTLHTAGIADLAEVVAIAQQAAGDAGLANPRITSDVKHVEIGLTDKADSARWAAEWLAERGITGGLVLLGGDEFGPIGGVAGSDSLMVVPELARAVVISVGVEPGGAPEGILHLGGGPARFGALLDDQLARRHDRRVPAIDDDPEWIVELSDTAKEERVTEAIGTLANGGVGLRGSREEDGPGTGALFIANGVYTGDGVPRLLEGPVWTDLAVHGTGRGGRRLDLRTGVLLRHDSQSGLRSLRFVSGARVDGGGLRAEAPVERLEPGRDDRSAQATSTAGGGITIAAHDRWAAARGRRSVERLVAWAADPHHVPAPATVGERLADLEAAGFDRLLAEHRESWARRWTDAGVWIDGAPDDQLAARFALFHLLAAAPDSGEAAVGPRGLSGQAYGGHVFWDADVYVLPALAAIRPSAARAMLEYRIRRLPAARAVAAALGYEGARFPWESADDGTDVTPRQLRGPAGEVIPVRTGEREEHIVADVAWAAHEYHAWTADPGFLHGSGRALIVDTARYWASRVHIDHAGHAHLDEVMGPDEYHDMVDDNAYTNVMARWNLRLAAALLEQDGEDPATVAAWRRLADRLVDGWDPEREVHEQFAGYWGLEPLLAEHIAPRPFAADLVLGTERVAATQLIKQPDVAMLHHLVPGELPPGSLIADLDFYEPRTTHGSSLSPAIYAALLARAGQPDRALEAFRIAARLDLDDLTGTTAGGLHLATMGGLWQALAYGFLGLRPEVDRLHIDPHLPEGWTALRLHLNFAGRHLRIRADHACVSVGCDAPAVVRVGGGGTVACTPPGCTFALEGGQGRTIDRSRP